MNTAGRKGFFSLISCVGIVLVMILSAGCTDKNSVPSDVLSKQKMESVLWDMVLADRFTSQFVTRDSARLNVKQETFRAYSQVFAIHKISGEEFFKSYKFYMSRPDLSRVLFDTIYARGNRLKEEAYRPKMDKPLDTSATADSLRTVMETRRKDSLRQVDSINRMVAREKLLMMRKADSVAGKNKRRLGLPPGAARPRVDTSKQ